MPTLASPKRIAAQASASARLLAEGRGVLGAVVDQGERPSGVLGKAGEIGVPSLVVS